MKKIMQKLTAALLALACVPVTANVAAESPSYRMEELQPWTDLSEMKLVGHGMMEEGYCQLYLLFPENEKSVSLAVVKPRTNYMRFVLRENADITDAARQIAEVLDAYIPGILSGYDADKLTASVTAPGHESDSTAACQAKLYSGRSYSKEQYFELYMHDIPANHAELEASILLDLARRHLLTAFYGWGETAVWDREDFIGLNYYPEKQTRKSTQSGTAYETINWEAVQAYLAENHPAYTAEKYDYTDTVQLYRITGTESLTVRKQIELACELWEQCGLYPIVYNFAEASDEETTGHNALERPGDTNLDCEVDIMDVIAANKHLLGVSQLDKTGTKNADTNGDGSVDSDDSLAILKAVLDIRD